jgi:hypothetical protein
MCTHQILRTRHIILNQHWVNYLDTLAAKFARYTIYFILFWADLQQADF